MFTCVIKGGASESDGCHQPRPCSVMSVSEVTHWLAPHSKSVTTFNKVFNILHFRLKKRDPFVPRLQGISIILPGVTSSPWER